MALRPPDISPLARCAPLRRADPLAEHGQDLPDEAAALN